MKKLISVLLALVMVLSFSVSAFAYTQYDSAENAAAYAADHEVWRDGGEGHTLKSLDDSEEDGSAKLDVYYNFDGGTNILTEPVYSVTITWSFTLQGDTLDTVAYEWDTENLKYVVVEGATAELTGGKIPVNICLLNNSNVPVDANCVWAASETYFGVSEHIKDGDSTEFEKFSLPSACKEGNSPEDLKYAYDELIDTDKTSAREDGKLVFKAGVDPTKETYNYKTTGIAGSRFDEQWDRTIEVSLKDDVDYSDPYGDYAMNKIGTYTVTLSLPTAETEEPEETD